MALFGALILTTYIVDPDQLLDLGNLGVQLLIISPVLILGGLMGIIKQLVKWSKTKDFDDHYH